jgi:hypothetical protein
LLFLMYTNKPPTNNPTTPKINPDKPEDCAESDGEVVAAGAMICVEVWTKNACALKNY